MYRTKVNTIIQIHLYYYIQYNVKVCLIIQFQKLLLISIKIFYFIFSKYFILKNLISKTSKITLFMHS